jgi:hypothetical protein
MMRTAAAQDALLFHGGALFSRDAGNTDQSLATLPGFNSVPYLWHFDPMTNGIPSPRSRNTYVFQEKGALANPRTAWRSFYVYQDAAVVIGGNSIDANDIADTIAWFQGQSYPIDYVFADLEGYYPDGDWSNTLNLIDQLRDSSQGANARIGNYQMYAGPAYLGTDYPYFSDRRVASANYLTNASNGMAGLTVSMPDAYAQSAYSLHADSSNWPANWWTQTGLPSDPASLASLLTYNQIAAIGAVYASPNERAGMFYAPLEEVSLAKRNLPAGHQLIPWIAAFIPNGGVPALSPGQAPTPQDNEALLEHLRLRGIDGFYAFSLQVPAYTGTYSDGTTFTVVSDSVYAADMQRIWKNMDWFFSLPAQVGTVESNAPLNLFTFKNTGGTYADPNGQNGGIEWSAYQRGNRVLAVISNLGNGAQAASGAGTGNNGNWTSVFTALGANLPAQSPSVPAGNHLVVEYLTNPTEMSFNAYPANTALGTAQGWHDSATDFVTESAAGSGDGVGQVITIRGGTAIAWVSNTSTANPGGIGATANDRMLYSFKVFTGWSGSGSASFAPVLGTGSAVPVPAQQNGPTFWVFAGGANKYFALGSSYSAGPTYQSTTVVPAMNTWYAVQLIVDPSADSATAYVMNLTSGGAWVQLQFGNSQTSVPAGLVQGQNSPSLYNGFQISGSAGAQFDAFAANLYPYPPSPVSSYTPPPPPPAPPVMPPTVTSGDAPMPLWALLSLAGATLGIGARAARRAG